MKKVLSLILTLGLIMSCFAGVSAFAEVSGDGSPETPYLITKGEELAALLNHATDGAENATKTYYITQDIIMPSNYVPVADFSGKIKGWDTNAPAQRSIYVMISGNGLFATATGAFEISNITLEGSVTASAGATGGFVGTVSESLSGAKITNCINNASVYNSNNTNTDGVNIGGFVGLASSNLEISHCVNTASVSGGNSHVGGIIGESTKAAVVITACANNGEVETRHSGGTIVGGIAGRSNSPISQCYNTGTITASSATGGITGRQQNTQPITNCFNIGAVKASNTSDKYAGGIVGYVYNKCSITDCYNAGVVTAATKGEIVGSVRSGNDPTVTDCYYLSGTTDASTGALSPDDMKKQESFNFDFDNTWEMAAATTNYKYPNLQSNLYYVEPNGTIDAPYLVANQADLEAIPSKGLNKVYSVAANFDVSSDYSPISDFTGTLIGNNKTITLNNTTNGIFASIKGSAIVSGLNVAGVISTNTDNIGGIAGKIDSTTASIENCVNSASVTGKNFTGGIAGVTKGNITNCVNNGTVTGPLRVGGIAGDQTGGTISYCVNNGTIVANKGTASSASCIGGIVGRSYAPGTRSVENSYNNGNITGSGWDMAGIVGAVHSGTLTISNCYNTGLISYVSGTGIFGAQNLNGATVTVSNCYDIGVVNTYTEKPQKPISKAAGITVLNCYYVGLFDDDTDNTNYLAKDAMNTEAVIASLGSAYELSSNGYNYPQLKNLENTKQVNIYTVNAVSEGNGTVTPTSAYIHGGDVIEITYGAENGYMLSDITASTGDVVNTANDGSYVTPVINEDTIFTFIFEKEESEVKFTLFNETILKDDFKDRITDVIYDDIADNYAAVIFVKVSNASGKYYGLEISDDETNWERTDLRKATGDVFPYGTYVHSKKQGATYYARVYEYDPATEVYRSFDNITFTLTKPE